MKVIKSNSGIGKRIKQRREDLDITQEELAERLGYSSKAIISFIENGKRDISQTKILTFAKVLHTTPEYLMGYVDNPENNEVDFKIDTELVDVVKNLDKDKYALLLAYAKLLEKS